MDSIITIRQLSFHYPDGTTAISDLSLDIFPGEKIALVGVNGAGKSTLLLHLNGILEGSGQIQVNGIRVQKENKGQVRTWVGLVFQNPDDQLFSPTVFEDIAYGPIYQGYSRDDVAVKVEQALAAVQMTGSAVRNPFHLSGGEKKRIAIATVLSMQPKILVLDKPTAGLDPRGRREIIALLRELPQTMIIATHDLSMVEQLTDRAIVMESGRIIADIPSRELLSKTTFLLDHGLA